MHGLGGSWPCYAMLMLTLQVKESTAQRRFEIGLDQIKLLQWGPMGAKIHTWL